MGSSHLLWLGMIIKTKETADEEKLKGWGPGVQRSLRRGREEALIWDGWMMEVRFKEWNTGV